MRGIPDPEVAAAAYYELARESKSFRYAATQFKRGKEDMICAPRSVAKDTPSQCSKRMIVSEAYFATAFRASNLRSQFWIVDYCNFHKKGLNSSPEPTSV